MFLVPSSPRELFEEQEDQMKTTHLEAKFTFEVRDSTDVLKDIQAHVAPETLVGVNEAVPGI